MTITRSELNKMAQIVLDEDTGMTVLDLWEWEFGNGEIHIIEDEEE